VRPNEPPAWAERLLSAVLPGADFRESVIGDLHEEYLARARKPSGRADLWYGIEAVRLFGRYAFRRRPREGADRPWRREAMSQMLRDARFAVRGMAKRPGLAFLVVTTLAVGLGANAAIFSILDALFLKPLPFPNAARLVRVWETAPGADIYDRGNVAPGNFRDWEAQSGKVLERLVALQAWDASLRGRDLAERVQGYRVSPGFFDTLGVAPRVGRGFLKEEGQSGSDRRVVLGHDLWERSFGGDPGILGRAVPIDGESYDVVGIAPSGFHFPDGAELWTPVVLPPEGAAPRDQHYFSAIALLAKGRSIRDASVTLSTVARRLQHDHPETNASRDIAVADLQRGFEDPSLLGILLLWQVAAGLVLLMACINVANLMLARGAERRRELALRLALGAGRRQVVQQLIVEGAVTALAAAAASLPLTAWAARELRLHMPAEIGRFVPGWERIGVDARTFAFSLGLALVATIVFTLVPALRASGGGLLDSLRDGGRGATAGALRQRGRSILVVVQIAGALGLVVVASLAVRSAHALILGPQGFDPDHLLTMRVTLPEGSYKDPDSRRAFMRSAEEKLAAIPGVTSTAFASVLPGRAYNTSRPIAVEGEPTFDRTNPPVVDDRAVSPGLLATLKIPILSGRSLDASDNEKGLPVAVVSRSLAERYWPGRDPIGRRFRLGGDEAPWLTVVGVSGDIIQQWVARRNYPTCYRPYAQDPLLDMGFVLRTTGDPEALIPSARSVISGVDPYQPAYQLWSMRESISLTTIGLQYLAAVMAAFGGLALVLAISGVYGVMSYRVSLRTLEIGVRVALGASAGDVLRLTMTQAFRLTIVGLIAGGAAGLAVAKGLSGVLEGAIPFDAATLVVTTGLLAATALVAAYIPARRALAVDPAEALRAQ
jgi:putative ABC transport system permease protein